MRIPIDKAPSGEAMNWAISKILSGHLFKGTGKIENRDSIISEFCTICGKPKGYHGYDNYRRIENAWRLVEYMQGSLSEQWETFCFELCDNFNLLRGSANGDASLRISRAFLRANGVKFIEIEDE